ncbi:MAG TPA: hypothetical protein VIV60_12260, partial [Polyangiaceae bacterium]
MSAADSKLRTTHRTQLDKADVESLYGEMVRVIGGNYFSNGNTVTNGTGILDWRNFRPDAGIPNANKSSPYGMFVINAVIDKYASGTTVSAVTPIPQLDLVQPPFGKNDFFVVGQYLAFATIGNAVNSGSWTYSTPSRTISTGTLTNVAAFTNVLTANLATPFKLYPREQVTFQFSIN